MKINFKKVLAFALTAAMLVSNNFAYAATTDKINENTAAVYNIESDEDYELGTDSDASFKSFRMESINFEDFEFNAGTDNQTNKEGVITKYKGKSKIVDIPEEINGKRVKAIGVGAFKDKGIVELNIPEGIEYIGKEAFKNNNIAEIHIPDSVKVIEEAAFENVNRAYTGDTVVTGMKGVSVLKPSSFGNIKSLVLEAPALEEINVTVFEPKVRYGNYARIMTENNENKHNLEARQGYYLIDPAKFHIVGKIYGDSETVIDRQAVTGENGLSDYPISSDVASFYKKGDELEKQKAGILDGYARSLKEESLTIESIEEDELEFLYKPLYISAPIAVNSTSVSGKVSIGKAKVELTDMSNMQVIEEIQADEYGSFTFNKLERNKEYRLKANFEDEDYAGSSFAHYFETKGDIKAMLGLPELASINLNLGDKLDAPRTVELKLEGGSSRTLNITWKNDRAVNTKKAGIYWIQGKATDYGMSGYNFNEYAVYQKIMVRSGDDDIHNTDKLELYRKITEAKELRDNAIISEDGEDVAANVLWTTRQEVIKLSEAIRKARRVGDSDKVNQDEVDTAVWELKAAIENYKSTRQPGKQIDDSALNVGIVEVIVSSEDFDEQNMNKLKVRLKKSNTKDVNKEADKVEKNESGVKYTFTDVPFGKWEVLAPEAYLAMSGNVRASKELTEVSITHRNQKITKFMDFKKALKVTYDLKDKGTSTDKLVMYYVYAEHWDDFPRPVVYAKTGYVFVGWSKDGTSVLQDHRAIIEDENLVAIYRKASDSIDENTSVGNGWVLGDFTYEKDVAQDSKDDAWVVTGFSSAGKNKAKKNFSLSIPAFTSAGKEVSAIGAHAFESKEIEYVEIPEGIENIYANAFYENNIKSVSLPNSLKVVGDNAFLRCRLEEVVLPKDLVRINDGAFAENRIKSIEIPAGVEVIEATAFAMNTGLSELKLNEGLTKIGKRAFHYCNLTKVKIPHTLTTLVEDAFEANPGLTSYKGKVGLYTDDGSNPHSLKDGIGHVINPIIEDGEISSQKAELFKLIREVQILRDSLNISEDGKNVPMDEEYVDTDVMDILEEALYTGYYSYYDDTAKESEIKYSVDVATSVLERAREEADKKKRNGEAKIPERANIMLVIGTPGIEYNRDIKEDEHHFVLKDRKNKSSKLFKWNKIINTSPHTAYLNWNIKNGEYEFIAPVGKVLVIQQGLNGKIVPEPNPYISIKNLGLSGGDYGFGMDEGIVYIYDLMDGGTSSDKLYETQLRGLGASKIPRVEANEGTYLAGWSLDGKTVIDIKQLKGNGNLIFKAVYKKGTDPDRAEKDALKNSLDKAKELLSIQTSIDGEDISIKDKWATKEDKEKLEAKVNEINDKLGTASKRALIKLKEELDKEISEFEAKLKNGKKLGENTDKNVLESLIKEAEGLREKTKISKDGSDVPQSAYWTERINDEALYEAVVNAFFVFSDKTASDEEVKEQCNSLSKALEIFKNERKSGSYENGNNQKGDAEGKTDENTKGTGGDKKGENIGGNDSGKTDENTKDNGSGKKDENIGGNANINHKGDDSGNTGGSTGKSGSGRGGFGSVGVSRTGMKKAVQGFDFSNIKTYDIQKDGSWHKINDNWVFVQKDSKVLRDTFAIIGRGEGKDKYSMYHFNKQGLLETGWIKVGNNDWYYANKQADGTEGVIRKGWFKDNNTNKWFYLNTDNGKMMTGWQLIAGKWYFLTPDGSGIFGALYQNAITPDGYLVDKDGVWMH